MSRIIRIITDFEINNEEDSLQSKLESSKVLSNSIESLRQYYSERYQGISTIKEIQKYPSCDPSDIALREAVQAFIFGCGSIWNNMRHALSVAEKLRREETGE